MTPVSTPIYIYHIAVKGIQKFSLRYGGGIVQWTVPQPSIIIIYNSSWSLLIQWIRVRGQRVGNPFYICNLETILELNE